MNTELEWNPDFSEHGVEHMLCGNYYLDPNGEEDDEENEVKIIATVLPSGDGFSWGISDTDIGPVDDGFELTREAARQAALKAAEEWENDEH